MPQETETVAIQSSHIEPSIWFRIGALALILGQCITITQLYLISDLLRMTPH